jgi:hypothetical protein
MNREQQQRETPMASFVHPAGGAAPRWVSFLACLLGCFLFPIRSLADSPPHIEKVQIGLPGGQGEQESARSRNGAWAPVYVKLKAGADGSGLGRYKVRVQTSDTENTDYHYDTALPALTANQDYIAVTYVRPGTAASDFSVSLVTADGQGVQGVPPVTRESDRDMLEPKDVMYVALGARLPGMKRALLADAAQANVADDDLADKKGTVRFAYIDDVYHMPDLWFGYDAADVVVLATGSESFVKSLLDDEAAPQRRKALAEWVRRGGKLVVSVGANRQLAAEVLDKMPLPDADRMPLINCRIEGTVSCPSTPNLQRWAGGGGQLNNVEFTRLVPGEGAVTLVSESATDAGKTRDCPVVVESACALGRVWLVAFDLDGPPFTTWGDGQKAFWNRVQSEFTPKATVGGQNPPPQPVGMRPGMPPNPDDETGFNETPSLLAELQRALENFESVPVVSFGWVALFILIYILIVGPLDYILLTRVFKRPELTWITFPVVVLSLSVLVYLVAYSMKGDDLRVNKIDLVEYDLGSPQQAYGNTWFTLFSPRIENYTFTVEPSAPAWAAAPPADATAHPVTVTGLANPDLSERAGSSSLFRKPYSYAEAASGMERVPIPVWSTRTFQASWRAGLDADKPPLKAELAPAKDPDKLTGTITNNLPVELQSVTLFYHGKYYLLQTALAPGKPFDVQELWKNNRAGRPAVQWIGDNQALAPPYNPQPAGVQPGGPNGQFNKIPAAYSGKAPFELMKDLMFHADSGGSVMNNCGLRMLDATWRIESARTSVKNQPGSAWRDEAVLVARTPNLSDKAETVAQNPGSATRIWLDRLPDGKNQRPGMTGFLAQETYVRAYLPVKTPDDKAP